MNQGDCQLVVKVQMVLHKLTAYISHDKSESYVMIEDDTTLQKLHTYIEDYLRKNENGLAWAQSTGLVDFINRAFDPSIVNVPENSSIVAFAIKVFGSLLRTKETFNYFSEDKVLMEFYVIWPNLRNNPALNSAALDLLNSLLNHESGLSWILKNGVWEKLLLPSLRSTSIFVQRKGVKVITSLMFLVLDSQHFELLVKDLLLVSNKFCEIQQHVEWSLSEEIRQSCQHVLLIFKELYIKTLGKKALYSKLKDIGDLRRHLLERVDTQVPVAIVMHIVDMFILDALHNFQEKIMDYGIIEQFLVDTLCADVIAFIKVLFDKGHVEAFFRSAVNVHKYWKILVMNIDKNKQMVLKEQESLLHLVTCYQVMPVSVLCKDFISNYPQKKGLFATWTEEVHCRIVIKECLRAEAAKVENQIISALTDSNVAVRMAVISTSSSSSAADHLTLMCAVTIFQGLVFLACMITENDSTGLRQERELQRTSIDTMRVLAEKFEIDWRKCFLSICLLHVLCKTLKVTNISTQVKLITLKAMKSCIVGFIPPSMAMLMNSEKQESNSVEHMGSVLSGCLSDTEWEVRDSALEVLNTCMTLAKDRYPFFAEWLIRYNLDTVVLAALEDIEGYVRASAFGVLACVVSNEKIWLKFSEENLQHRALAAILWEGDAPVRRSAMCMVRELHAASKFSEEDLNDIVINIMQRSTEDDDDEIRLNALEFIHSHINEGLQKSGMVDGEFPAVTFKGGKITKLDKHEVQKQILKVITWICDCGYLNCLLLCANDPVTAVAKKSREIFVFLNNLLSKYEMKTGAHLVKRRNFEDIDIQFKSVTVPKENVVGVAGQDVMITNDVHELEVIDKTISDILHSSTLDNVSSIRRPLNDAQENQRADHKYVVITPEDVPLRKAAIPVEYLLQSLDNICRHEIAQDSMTTVNMLSLLDDILLEGCKVESQDSDDQHLRDCY
ncbi:BRCA1-associated ATM activator 1 [Macrobrachium rosenbergii]|uniref:BRCA1-associated ATM activator 1 n=1 Tax=Macrobrachium rosenbergii TaxID=79674 RepID=UPI0034D7861A